MIRIIIDALPPTVNHMYITCKGGRKALSAEAEAFRKLVLAALSGVLPAVPEGPLEFTLRLTLDTKRRQDIDNRIKAALDAVAIALRFDDCRVSRIIVERAGYAAKQPRCEIEIGVLG